MDCRVKKGCIHYEIIGDGFPLIILHTMGTDHRSMKAWMEPIFKNATGFQRVYIDLPAHGKSKIDTSFSGSDDMLLNILDFLDQKFPNVMLSLIGSSYGGYLAQGILDDRPQQVKSICLLVTALHLTERRLPEKVILEKDQELLRSLEVDIRTAFETLMIYQNQVSLHYFLEEIQPGRLLANRTFLTSDWRKEGYFFSKEPFDQFEALPHPALIILGKQDAICGYKDHVILIDKFPNSTFSILDRAGHMLHIDKRSLVQELVKDWLIRTKSLISNPFFGVVESKMFE